MNAAPGGCPTACRPGRGARCFGAGGHAGNSRVRRRCAAVQLCLGMAQPIPRAAVRGALGRLARRSLRPCTVTSRCTHTLVVGMPGLPWYRSREKRRTLSEVQMTTTPSTGLQLRSTVKQEGLLELSLADVPIPDPKPDEVVVRVEASPINPSDLGLLFGGADMSTAKVSGTPERPVVTATVGPEMMRGLAGRIDQSMPVGNEGAGVVVSAGSSPAAQELLGKTVAMLGGAMYAQYRTIKASAVPRPARGRDARRRRLVLRQSAHGARHGGDHASRRAHGARAHGGGIEPRPDAGQALQRGWDRPRQHRAQAGAGRAADIDRRHTTSATRARRRSWTI